MDFQSLEKQFSKLLARLKKIMYQPTILFEDGKLFAILVCDACSTHIQLKWSPKLEEINRRGPSCIKCRRV